MHAALILIGTPLALAAIFGARALWVRNTCEHHVAYLDDIGDLRCSRCNNDLLS